MGVFTDIYFWRQFIVLLANCISSVGIGFMMSFPSVLNSDILSPNGTTGIHATSDQASWIASSNGISGFFGFCVIPYMMQVYGRKYVSIGLNFISALGFLIFALATNIPCLFAARIMQGIPICGILVSAVILGEYSDPKRRGYFLTIKKSSAAIGFLLCHSLGLKWTWKQIAVVAVIPNTMAIILTLLCPESPSYLAFIGQYVECEKSYKWLFADNRKSRRHLEDLITTQMEYKEHNKSKKSFTTFFKSLIKRDFVKPLIICFLLSMLIDASGKYYFPTYVLLILSAVTKDESMASYFTIISDILTFVALLLSCFIIRYCKRRTLLFTSGITCVILMCLAILMIFLKTHYDIGNSVYWWLTPLVILLIIFVANIGIIPTCFAIMGEIFPLEHKGTGTTATGIAFTVLYTIVMKCTPIMIEKTGVVGTFGIYALVIFVGLSILFFILNETKDKTLQEIERDIKGVKQSKFREKPLIE